MGTNGGNEVIERMREKIEARGGKMLNSFSVKTGGKELDAINNDTNKIIEDMDIKI